MSVQIADGWVGGIIYYFKGAITLKPLTGKQKSWIEHYKNGNTAAKAAILAGYNAKSQHAFESIGSENLKKLGNYLNDNLAENRVRDELNKFWSEIMNDPDTDIRQRIKVSELKAKAAGVFEKDQEQGDSSPSVIFLGEDELYD